MRTWRRRGEARRGEASSMSTRELMALAKPHYASMSTRELMALAKVTGMM